MFDLKAQDGVIEREVEMIAPSTANFEPDADNWPAAIPARPLLVPAG